MNVIRMSVVKYGEALIVACQELLIFSERIDDISTEVPTYLIENLKEVLEIANGEKDAKDT